MSWLCTKNNGLSTYQLLLFNIAGVNDMVDTEQYFFSTFYKGIKSIQSTKDNHYLVYIVK